MINYVSYECCVIQWGQRHGLIKQNRGIKAEENTSKWQKTVRVTLSDSLTGYGPSFQADAFEGDSLSRVVADSIA